VRDAACTRIVHALTTRLLYVDHMRMSAQESVESGHAQGAGISTQHQVLQARQVCDS
jgi:hypothetical protein